MKASKIDAHGWAQIKHFGPDEFMGWKEQCGALVQPPPPSSMLPFLDAEVVYVLDKLRDILGARLLVSRAEGAIARTWSPDSQHYCVGCSGSLGRVSRACDLWVPDSTLQEAYVAAQDVPGIGSFGAYPQWHTYPGIHIDIRPRKANGDIAKWMAYYQGVGKKNVLQVYRALDWVKVEKMIAERSK